VKAEAVAVLRCPRCCTNGMLALTAWGTDGIEVGEGPLDCQICAAAFRVTDGIADLLHEPPEFVRREAAGLERFVDVMREDVVRSRR
jgi:uncharacterized protein YbaR (Trm112 family)